MDETERRFIELFFGGAFVILLTGPVLGAAAGLTVWAFRVASGL